MFELKVHGYDSRFLTVSISAKTSLIRETCIPTYCVHHVYLQVHTVVIGNYSKYGFFIIKALIFYLTMFEHFAVVYLTLGIGW